MYSHEPHVGIAGIRMVIEIRMEFHFFGAVARLLFVCVLCLCRVLCRCLRGRRCLCI